MEVPFARFLTRFPVDDDLAADTIDLEMPFDLDPLAEAAKAEEEARLEAEHLLEAQLAEARQEVEARSLQEIAELKTAHEAALAAAIADARTEWCNAEGMALAQRLDAALVELHSDLDGKIANVLTPLLAQAVIARTRATLIDSLGLILADPKHPILTVQGPGDLLDAIRAAQPRAVGVEYVAHDELDAIVKSDGIRIETQLEAAIALLANMEA